ncbi:MAG TPA: DUF222 domain-containing protein [Acidimicrobiales bacterium]|nr:DUF222 domain-containing protein [Acidimicrobiales bacterium]
MNEVVRNHTDDIERLDRAFSAMTAASAAALRAIVAMDEQRRWRRDGATSMTSWLAARYGLAWGTAREWVRVARALTRLPAIRRAYEAGRLSWDKILPLTRFATPETDGHWARRAERLRPSTLWREARRHTRLQPKDAETIHRARGLRLVWDLERPVLWLEGSLGAEQGTALQAALGHHAERVPRDPDADIPEDARLADALVEAVASERDGAGADTTVVIHADAQVVAGREPARGPWLAETEGGQRITAEAVRRLACDGRIEWVLERDGRPVGIGRRGRAVPGQLLRVLRHRDGACRFPGCERKRWLNAHHLVHWADGGATNLDNLVLLCHFHHRLIHEGGWRTSGHPGTDLRFHDPTGRPLRTGVAPRAPAPLRL